MLDLGRVVERYRIESVLGEGGMAVVYLVVHETLGTTHALKVLSVGSKDVQRRMVQEGRVQATLRHPNIVAVTDVLDIANSPALLMEYIEGPSMDYWLSTYKPTIAEAVTLFRGIVNGVRHAHDKGLIHRDLKPANILLQPTAEGVVPKVTDFGLAKAMRSDATNVRKTRAGATMGTPAYMAPEQVRDASTVDHRADVYSLGCILYELVCGRTPYEAPDVLAMFALAAEGKYPHPRELNSSIPDEICSAIEYALHKDPEQRIQNCEALLNALTPPRSSRSSITAEFPASVLAPTTEAAAAVAALAGRRPSHLAHGSQIPTPTWAGSMPGTPPSAVARPFVPKTLMDPSITSLGSPQVSGTSLAPAGSPWPARIVIAGGVALLACLATLVVLLGLYIALNDESAPTVVEAPVAPVVAPVVPVEVAPPPAEVVTPPVEVVAVVPSPVPDVAPVKKPTKTTVVVDSPVAAVRPPKPAAEPEAATFEYSGATTLVLYNSSGEFAAGRPIPAGEYKIRAWFDGQPVEAGRVTVAAGQPFTIKCNAAMLVCRRQ